MPRKNLPAPIRLRHAASGAAGFVLALLLVGTGLSSAKTTTDQRFLLDAPDPEAESLAQRLNDDVIPILDANCFACHGQRRGKGGVRFHEINSLESAAMELETLLTARDLVSTHEMPPPDEPQPTDEQRAVLLAWIDDFRDHTLGAQGIDPGWFSTRRLNNDEYRLTMRDLLGIDPSRVDIAEGLPADDLGHGFNTIGDALTLSALHIEQYLAAAERALDLSLGPAVEISTKPVKLGPLEGGRGSRELDGGGQYMFGGGAIRTVVNLSAPSLYEFTVTAWGQHGGPDLPRLSLRCDGIELAAWSIESQDRANPERHRVTVELDAGPHEITAHFTNDYYKKDEADRNLAVESIELTGPLDAASAKRSPAWESVFFVDAEPGPSGERSAATRIIDRFAARAFGRPLSDEQSQSLLALYDEARTAGDGYESAVRLMLQAVLVSPSFLFMNVANPDADDPGKVYTLDGYELASRLSYFLWGSLPDDELRRLAGLELLQDPRVLRTQVRRMLADPRADAFIESFAGQWLLLRNLEALEIDREQYKGYDDELIAAMTREALLFFADVVRANRPVMDLVSARDVFLNQRLAAHYGIEGIRGDRFRKVVLDDDSERGGILTMGAVLTVTSNPTRTSPVKRGHFVLDQVLGTPPPPPPPDIPPLEQTESSLPENASLRDQLKAHLLDSTCASCHSRMDPIGLSMEQFDAVGRWRTGSEAEEIDVSAELPGGITFEGPRELKAVLAASEPQINENITRRLMTYALGRGLESFDRPSVDAIMEDAAANGGGMMDLIEAVVLSEAFTTCRGREMED